MNQLSNAVEETFADQLRLWRVGANLTQAEAAEKLGIARAYLSQIEGGRKPGARLRTRFLLEEKAASLKSHSIILGGLRNLPVLSWAQAGEATEFSEIPESWDEVVPSDATDKHAIGVRLRGDSMEPKFSDGDVAILLPSLAPTNGDIVVANLKDEGVVCKLMHVQLDKNLITLSSYNPAYPPMVRHRDQFNWLVPVSSVVKQLRKK